MVAFLIYSVFRGLTYDYINSWFDTKSPGAILNARSAAPREARGEAQDAPNRIGRIAVLHARSAPEGRGTGCAESPYAAHKF
jgi:hypothetical protein